MDSKPRVRTNADGTATISYDGLQNLVSGLGTRADKRSHNRFVFGANYFDFHEMEAAYSENWIARQIVDVPVSDALREWREWKCKDAAEIRKEEKRLGVRKHFGEGQRWSRLYGGACILMITDQPLDQPLDVRKIGKGGLQRLVTLDRWELSPQVTNYVNPVAADYLMPEFYTVAGGTGMIHSSHVIRLDGEDLPRRLRALNNSWGDSRLRQVLEDLRDVTSTKSGIAAMVQEANVDVVSRQGLGNELATDQEEGIMKRFALGAQMKSLVNMLLLDGEETYERKSLSFSGLEGILDKLMIWVSGAADIPMTRLFGRSAAGMNSTGEGDLGNYYDALAGTQEDKYRPQLERLDEVMVRSALGGIPEDCEWEWNPLYQESGTELAQQELAYAQSESLRIQEGILRGSQVALRLKNAGRYAITDKDIERMKAEETLDDDPFNDELVPAISFDESFEPPEAVRKAAQQGLDYRDKYNRGGTEFGIARARDLSNGRAVSPDTINRMVSFFARHAENRDPDGKESDGGPTNGWIAWLQWGGDAGKAWSERMQKRLESNE